MSSDGRPLRRFKYVYIPAELHVQMEERTMAIPDEDKEVECFLDACKEHFTRAGGSRTDAQRRAQKEALLRQMGDKGKDVSEHLLQVATDMQMVENISLLANHRDVGFVGVNMYCDDQAQIKELPLNPRASQVAEVCGKLIQVRGDAFLARVFDNEDSFRRMDLELSEVSSSADWVKQAKLQAQRREAAGGVRSGDELMAQLQATRGAGAPSSSVQVRELSPAEAAKEEGNAAVKRGWWEEAEQAYARALSLDPGLVAAANNRALALLKLGRHADAAAACELVLAAEPANVKALLRRAAAHEAQGNLDAAVADFTAALQLEPSNRDAASGLDRLRPAPPPPSDQGMDAEVDIQAEAGPCQAGSGPSRGPGDAAQADEAMQAPECRATGGEAGGVAQMVSV